MENIITHYPESGGVEQQPSQPSNLKPVGLQVAGGAQHQTKMFSDHSRPESKDDQVSRRNSSPSPRRSGHADFVRSDLAHPLATDPDPDVEDFVHVDAPASPPTQSSPGNRSICAVGLQNGLGRSSHSHSITSPIGQLKEGESCVINSLPCPHKDTPYDSSSPRHLNRSIPGAYDSAQFNDEGADDIASAARVTPISEPREEILSRHAPNIVIFGETGVGKSSIINLVAGQKLAGTSNATLGCTFQHKRYPITLGNTSFVLWDTTGLDEGTEGTVPARLAEKNLKELIQGLAHSGGIHLIIYCIRGARLTKALRHNYTLFYDAVCRKKAPVALVVTGLEHQLDEMETWWTENEAVLRRYGMQFNAHACVTTLDVEDGIIPQRRSQSQIQLRELVVEYAQRPGWKIDPSIMSWLSPLFRNLRGTSFTGILGGTASVRKVTICGSFPELLPGLIADYHKSTERIGDRQYEFVRVDKHALHTLTPRALENYGGTGAGVLVFYTSTLVDLRIQQADIDALKRFYSIAGGQSRPVIVALQGYDDEVVRRSWGDFASCHTDISAHLISLPSKLTSARAELDGMIEALYPQTELKSSGPNFLQKFMNAIQSYLCLDDSSTSELFH